VADQSAAEASAKEMLDQTKKKKLKGKPGMLRGSLVKGVSILLPALITVAIFFWGWGILRDYVVVSIIRLIDTPEFFSPTEDTLMNDAQITAALGELKGNPLEGKKLDLSNPAVRGEALNVIVDRSASPTKMKPFWETPSGSIYRIDPKRGHQNVFLQPDETYSILTIGSAEFSQQRDYNTASGGVENYTRFEYIVAVALAILLIVLLGGFARNYIGRHLVALFDRVLNKVPVVRLIYPYAKQVVDFFFTEEKPIEFDSVVAVEWPSGGYQLAFITGAGLKSLTAVVEEPMVTVFVPMSPLPMTGFTLYFPVSKVIEVNMTVEEAFMVVLSGGVLAPPAESMMRAINREDWQRRMDVAQEERRKIFAAGMSEDEATGEGSASTRTKTASESVLLRRIKEGNFPQHSERMPGVDDPQKNDPGQGDSES